MPIILRALRRALGRRARVQIPDRLPDLTPRQLDAIRRHDEARRAYRGAP